MIDPSAILRGGSAILDSVAALAVAVKPDPAVAAARAERAAGLDRIRFAHHAAELVRLRSMLRTARPTRRNRARLDAVRAEIKALGLTL